MARLPYITVVTVDAKPRRRFREIAIAVMFAEAGLAIAALTYFGCRAIKQWGDVGPQASATFQAINRPCRTKDKSGNVLPCGTLADVNETLHTVRGTVGEVEKAAKHEDAQLTTLDTQERSLFNDVRGTISDARETLRATTGFANAASGTMGTTQETLRTSQTALASLDETIRSSRDLVESLRRRVDDPRVDHLITNLDGTAQHVNAATGDVETVFNRVAHPAPCKGRWCWAITTAKVISATRGVPEFGYWTDQLIQSLRGH